MTDTPRPLVAGNWKMNGLQADLAQIALMTDDRPNCDLLICPPFTLIAAAQIKAQGSIISIGAQDCHPAVSGAHTGDVSAGMLADLGCTHVIVGHSERRADHGETDQLVHAKAEAVIRAGMTAIICVGETEAERDAGQTMDRVLSQLAGSVPTTASSDNVIVAYEPVWAIGTGRTPTPADVADVHNGLRMALVDRFADQGHAIRLLYGGSVKPQNAQELMSVSNVNGALVGGASLTADSFLGIAAAYD